MAPTIKVAVLEDQELDRDQVLELVQDKLSLIGHACGGMGDGIAAPPFDPEVRAAAARLAIDVNNLLTAFRDDPSAPRFAIRFNPSASSAREAEIARAWLAVGALLGGTACPAEEVEDRASELAPIVSLLRSLRIEQIDDFRRRKPAA